MQNSGDSLLLSLLAVLIPAIGLLVGTALYAQTLLARYRRVLKRLYRSSFKGVDSERKRIARELHDHLGAHSVELSEGFERVRAADGEEAQLRLEDLERRFHAFRMETHRIVEYLYPKGLVEPNWQTSFERLAQQLSVGDVSVEFESVGTQMPPNDSLHHTYWAVHEMAVNAIQHAGARRIQIAAVSEVNGMTLSLLYPATPLAVDWLRKDRSDSRGFGEWIIKDRLTMVGATHRVEVVDGFVTQLVHLGYEGPGAR
jgi:signal transduction histidine kinase